MAKLNSKKREKSSFYEEKSLVGLTPVLHSTFDIHSYCWNLTQGSQTHGPRVAFGPPAAFVRPGNLSKTDKINFFEQSWVTFRAFLVICVSQKLSLIKLWPAEHFFFRMWPFDQFEFETPALTCLQREPLGHKKSVSCRLLFFLFRVYLSDKSSKYDLKIQPVHIAR